MNKHIKKLAKAFDVKDVLIMLCVSVVLLFGMSRHVTQLERARISTLKDIDNYSTDAYLDEDQTAINELKRSYEEPIKKSATLQMLRERYQSFQDDLGEFSTRKQEVQKYVDKLNKQIEGLNSKDDKTKAGDLVKDFQEEAAPLTSKVDIEMSYTTYKSKISTSYKTRAQVKKEQEEKNYLYGTWYLPNTNEYSFTLSSDGSFVMPIAYKTTEWKRGKRVESTKEGELRGSWAIKDSTIEIYITTNTLDDKYAPYTWTFEYNKPDKVLEGTGDYAGKSYERMD